MSAYRVRLNNVSLALVNCIQFENDTEKFHSEGQRAHQNNLLHHPIHGQFTAFVLNRLRRAQAHTKTNSHNRIIEYINIHIGRG